MINPVQAYTRLAWLASEIFQRVSFRPLKGLKFTCRDETPNSPRVSGVRPEAALAKIAPYNWHGFFTARIYNIAARAPLDGISRAGWKLVYDARPNGFHRTRATVNKEIDHTLSLGLMLSPAGAVKGVAVDWPSWRGGFGPGMKVVAVNGRTFTPEVLEDELNAARTTTAPIEFAIEHGEELRTLRVDVGFGSGSQSLAGNAALREGRGATENWVLGRSRYGTASH